MWLDQCPQLLMAPAIFSGGPRNSHRNRSVYAFGDPVDRMSLIGDFYEPYADVSPGAVG